MRRIEPSFLLREERHNEAHRALLPPGLMWLMSVIPSCLPG